MWARKEGGRFLLRLDDTDAERSSEAFAQSIRDDLVWLGLAPDAVAVEGSPSWVTRGANGVFYAGLEGTGGVQAFAEVAADGGLPFWRDVQVVE